ncbi:M23 family metallopeptidase [uncultured Stenotrophomonas sp.]|uniref:M23 family metallopeptidase n=1 Tax=uncultured Stenotrophomonas sp. TaxID=165438 RepID=UPI0025E30AE9|nr:M23 family metallopeptidase [uncultured Stenotrophomonas sp.]
MPRTIPVLLSLALLCASGAEASPSSRWREAWGLPTASAPAVAASTSDAFASLQLQARAGGRSAVVSNLTAGPVQVRLQGDSRAPAATVLAAGEKRSLLWLEDDGNPLRLALDAFPGDPAAQPQDHLYLLPLQSASIRVSQAFAGQYSHSDAQNMYAVDFPVPEGTPVLAARSGQVMQVVDSREQGSLLRILHSDGSMAVYAHLQAGSATLRPGQSVAVGQAIALSGNTGHSSGPHLHFVVQANTGLALRSIPFRMGSARGELKFPRQTP